MLVHGRSDLLRSGPSSDVKGNTGLDSSVFRPRNKGDNLHTYANNGWLPIRFRTNLEISGCDKEVNTVLQCLTKFSIHVFIHLLKCYRARPHLPLGDLSSGLVVLKPSPFIKSLGLIKLSYSCMYFTALPIESFLVSQLILILFFTDPVSNKYVILGYYRSNAVHKIRHCEKNGHNTWIQ